MFYLVLYGFVHESALLEVQKFHSHSGGIAYKDGIYEEKVECAKEILQLPCSQSVARSTQRRHKSRCYGHARYYIALFLACQSHDTSQSTEEAYHHIVDGGRCARQ